MKTLFVALFALGLCLTPAHSEGQSGSALAPGDVRQVNELTEAFARGILAKEWKTVSTLYASNAVLYPPGETAVKGRDSIEACLAGLPAMTGFTMRTTSVEGGGDVAYAQGTYTMTIVAPREAKPIQASGYFLTISRKQSDGRWLIAVHMFTVHE